MLSLILAMALAGSDPATEAASQAAPAQAEADKKGNKDERFCRNEAPMGSRIKKIRCYNKQEFERRQLEEQQNLQRIQNDARAPASG